MPVVYDFIVAGVASLKELCGQKQLACDFICGLFRETLPLCGFGKHCLCAVVVETKSSENSLWSKLCNVHSARCVFSDALVVYPSWALFASEIFLLFYVRGRN